jgi:hypothetical protein
MLEERKQIIEKILGGSASTKEKRKKTCIEVYGTDNVAKNDEIKKKQEETNYYDINN